MAMRNAVWDILMVIAVFLALNGCETKSAAKAQAAANARAAYEAGQADAYRQMLQQSQGPSVHVVGHVNNPNIPWKDGLTLSQVLVDAECTDQGDPRAIFVTRQGRRYPVDVKALLGGQDWPMQAGDMVEINP
jgi:hypothetical protein